MLLREEQAADREAVRLVNTLAFGRASEADLVERLRDAGLVVASLVAEEEGRVVAHILFTRLEMETARGPVAAASLAPMAVLPERQRRGIGSALVPRGLELCRERGVVVVVVVGHPTYYPRFGFSAELARRLRAPFSGESFMAVELEPGVMAGRSGWVRYPDAFGALPAQLP